MIANNKIVFWTKVLHRSRTFLTPALKLGLMNDSSFSGFSHDVLVFVRYSTLLFLTVFFVACTSSPEPINYGKDECEHCRMMITDNKYGAEVVTGKGKVYKFDSIECLVGYSLEINIIGDNEQAFLVTNFSKPENLIDARSAFYIHNDNFRSPMGLNVSAFENKSEMKAFLLKDGSKKLSWFDVIEMVKQSTM
jgi:copper chaperone NosL